MPGRMTFEEWYKTVPKEKNDTINYNLRLAYEMLPQKELDNFISIPEAHLKNVVYDPSIDTYTFLKSKDHESVNKELEWYWSDSPEAIAFRNNYVLMTQISFINMYQ